MDAATIRRIEKEGAEALLDMGVSVPLKEIRLPFRRKPVLFRMTMKRPCMDGQLHIARIYLSLNVTAEQMKAFSKEEQMEFLVKNIKPVSRMLAYTLCRSFLMRRLGISLGAWFIRNFVEHRYALALFRTFVRLMGTDPFINIIRSAERANPMKARLSHTAKGS